MCVHLLCDDCFFLFYTKYCSYCCAQTANAVAILQARELIVSILTHWPWRLKRMLSLKVLLGEADIMKNFGMVDLICSTETDCGAKMVRTSLLW